MTVTLSVEQWLAVSRCITYAPQDTESKEWRLLFAAGNSISQRLNMTVPVGVV